MAPDLGGSLPLLIGDSSRHRPALTNRPDDTLADHFFGACL